MDFTIQDFAFYDESVLTYNIIFRFVIDFHLLEHVWAQLLGLQ